MLLPNHHAGRRLAPMAGRTSRRHLERDWGGQSVRGARYRTPMVGSREFRLFPAHRCPWPRIPDRPSGRRRSGTRPRATVAQASTVAGEVAKDIAQVNEISREVVTGSGQVSANARELSELSDRLRELMGQFKL